MNGISNGGVRVFFHSLPHTAGIREKYSRFARYNLLACHLPVTHQPHALAIIDGTLVELDQTGGRAALRSPLATAVVEFCPGAMCFYVREHPYGFLPGISNLYSLDGALRLRWIADWPRTDDPCAKIIGEEGAELVALSMSGAEVRFEASNGRFVSWNQSIAQAS